MGDDSEKKKHGCFTSKTPGYTNYEYMGDASIDQYSGWMFGLATAYDLISDTKLRNMIKTDVKKFIDHLMDHQYTFHSVKGGNWPLSFPVSNGKKAITLSHIRAMAHMTNNKGKYKDEFEKKAKKWMGCAKKWLESRATTKNDWDLDKKTISDFILLRFPFLLRCALRIPIRYVMPGKLSSTICGTEITRNLKESKTIRT